MTWTAEGVVQIGMLPDTPPATPPITPWYVEPTRRLDKAGFRALIATIRSERIPGLSLRGQPVATWLGELVDLPALNALVLDDTEIVDPSVPGLALRRLYLARTPIDDTTVVRVVAAQPALEVLDLDGCAVGDSAARAAASLTGLRALNLARTGVTDEGGAALGELAQLEVLDLGSTRVGPHTIEAIRPLALRELFLDHTRVGPELASLDGYAPGLVRFDASSLISYKPRDSDVGWLASAPNLVEVGLSGAAVHDELVARLATLPQLRVLRLAGTPISKRAVQSIAARTELEEIDLADTPVDSVSAAALLALPRLRVLRLDGTPIDDAALSATPGPELAELYLSRTHIDDAGTAMLEATPRLIALGLGETEIGDATLARVARLTSLHTLVLSSTRGSTKALAKLGALLALDHLYLDRTSADDFTLAALAGLHALRVLHLQETEISDDSLAVLREFVALREVTLGDTRLQTPLTVLDAWPRIHTLSLVGLPVGDAGLEALVGRLSLTTLDLSATDVTDPARLAALPRLRTLGLADTKLSQAGQASVAALAARGVEIVR
jgi:Leucine-rich repeat (LRR) protein